MATKQKLNKAVTAERAIAQMNSGNAAPDAMLRLQDGIQQMFRGYAQVFSALADLTGQPLVGSNPLVGNQSSKEELVSAGNQKNNVPAFQSAKSVERPVEQKNEAAAGEAVTQTEPEQAEKPAEAEKPVQAECADAASVQTSEMAQTSDTAQTSEAAQPSSEAAETKTVQISKDDILREIQGKFKKDKKNQERVRNILGAYGIVNLSQLPAEKYADFINDVRQL